MGTTRKNEKSILIVSGNTTDIGCYWDEDLLDEDICIKEYKWDFPYLWDFYQSKTKNLNHHKVEYYDSKFSPAEIVCTY